MTVADPGLGLDDVNLENDVFADRVVAVSRDTKTLSACRCA